ncbi:putative hexose phosphate transport protein [Porphyridium purpureum]|uniref:Putative hexose phosphate transport protein n=1 Tax=Porphyridium purpureum TaxID=35688 RepID=A0A5J4Z4L6_PORPP|nr:putative hexose phosphate transport protein [Porphyridium purpureum]|eukprot:POR4067..scf295_1
MMFVPVQPLQARLQLGRLRKDDAMGRRPRAPRERSVPGPHARSVLRRTRLSPISMSSAAGAGAGGSYGERNFDKLEESAKKTEKKVEGEGVAEDPNEKKTKRWRIRIFYSIFLGYATYYFTRNSFTYAAPGMRAALGLSLEQLGVITSIFPMAYGVSKLLAGILSDQFSTRVFMAFGLAATGVLNILFGTQSTMLGLCLLWALNGVFQGFGAPPCAKLLTMWYPKKERGTWWGFWNTSHNTGGFLIPFLSGYAVRNFGWRYGMYVPGGIAVVMGLFLFDRIRDSPEDVGLPPVDPVDQSEREKAAPKDGDAPAAKLSMRETLFKHVLSNPYVWLLALSYFFVYFVRQGISSWAYIYLLDFKGVPNPQDAAFRMSGMEIGGLLGSLASGYTSDKMLRGRRIPVIIGWLVGLIAAIAALWYVPVGMKYLNWLAIFAIGFFIYGPQMLVGLAGAELVDKSAVSSTIGLLGWIAYLGASVAGYPLTKIVTNFGWKAYILALMAFSGVAILLLLPMWSLGVVPEAVLTRQQVLAGFRPPCSQCAGTGTVMRLECGSATPSQSLSCKYVEDVCPWCDGTGVNRKAAVAAGN